MKKDCPQPYVREEPITNEISKEIGRVALPAEWAGWMIEELESERNQDNQSRQECFRSIKSQIKEIDQKLERLMQAYLDKVLSLEEYREAKTGLIEEKQELKDKITGLETNQGSWFKPAIRFVKAAKQALFLAENGSREEQRDFLKKVGSNFTISNRHLSVEPRQS